MKTVSSQLVCFIWDGLKTEIEERDIIRITGIDEKERHHTGGRIDQYRYRKLLQLIDANQLPVQIPEQGMIKALYAGFSDIMNLLLNAPTLAQALQLFLHYRPCIGELDTVTFTQDDHYLNIGYHTELHEFAGIRSAVSNFNIIDNLVDYYHAGTASWCEMILDDQFSDNIFSDNITGHFSDSFHCMIKTGDQNIYRIPLQICHRPVTHYNHILQPYLTEKADQCLQNMAVADLYSSQVRLLIQNYFNLSPEQHPQDSSLQHWICEQSNISRWTLTRRLQQEGTTFTQLHSELRCHEACRLLQKEQHSLLDISQKLGFVNQSAFQRFFREQMQCTPLKYRKRYTRPIRSDHD